MKLLGLSQISLGMIIFSGVSFATCLPTTASTLYSVTELSNPNIDVIAYDINNLGQVVGGYFTYSTDFSNSISYSFRTSANSPINTATDNLGIPFSQALSINDLGQVVGLSFNSEVGLSGAYRTDPNSPINPATDGFAEGRFSIFSAATGINNSGQVVIINPLLRLGTESYRVDTNTSTNEEEYTNLGSLGGVISGPFPFKYTSVSDINESGQVVGTSLNSNLEYHAYRTNPNSPINRDTDDLGTLGGSESYATAINNLGQVVGYSTNINGEFRAFLTAPNSPINPTTSDLGTLGGSSSSASDINDLGQVVGTSTTITGESRAFLYDDGKLFDLNSLIPNNSGVTLNYANAINDRSQILAGTFGDINAGVFRRAFLLTPIGSTSVPESFSGLGVLGFAAMSATFLTRKKSLSFLKK
ncbi:MAG TPA: DUF3466 family protein [Leptolyngbyaceae cyanobacterium]